MYSPLSISLASASSRCPRMQEATVEASRLGLDGLCRAMGVWVCWMGVPQANGDTAISILHPSGVDEHSEVVLGTIVGQLDGIVVSLMRGEVYVFGDTLSHSLLLARAALRIVTGTQGAMW
jgi:hypothetical protein